LANVKKEMANKVVRLILKDCNIAILFFNTR